MAVQADAARGRPVRLKMLRRLLAKTRGPRQVPSGKPLALPRFRSGIGVEGWVGEANAERIVGRAYRPNQLDRRLELALYDGERFVTSLIADLRREDLVQRGIGDGCYGFAFHIPTAIRDGQPHELDIRIARTAQSLLRQPVRVRLEASSKVERGAAAQRDGRPRKGTGHTNLMEESAGSAPGRGAGKEALGSAKPQSESDGRPVAQPQAELDEGAAVALVASSPLFDRTWYLAQYPEVAGLGIDPALHYVRHGAAKRLRPSLRFDPDYYLEADPDVAASGSNPLVHYLAVGRAQGRAPMALFEPVPLQGTGAPAPIVETPTGLDRTEIPWVRQASLADVAVARGTLRFGDVDMGPAGPNVELAALHAYCGLFGLDAAQTMRWRASDGTETAAAPVIADALRGFCPLLSTGRAQLADAWFADERTVRLRFDRDRETTSIDGLVVRGFQGSVADPAALALCGEALLPAAGPAFVDIALTDALLPVVLVFADQAGEVQALDLIPFPSLLRSGVHHAELVAIAERPSPIDDVRHYSSALLRRMSAGPSSSAVGRIVVSRQGATGAEPIFLRSFVEWLARVFGVGVALEASPAEADESATAFLRTRLAAGESFLADVSTSEERATLRLPPDSIPTIAVMALRHLPMNHTSAIGSFLVAETPSRRPRWAVTLPVTDDGLAGLQPAATAVAYPRIERSGSPTAGSSVDLMGLHVAIRHRSFAAAREASLMMPRAPDAPGPVLRRGGAVGSPEVSVLVLAEDMIAAERLLVSLAQQTVAGSLRVNVRLKPDAAPAADQLQHTLERLFPGRADLAAIIGGDVRAAIGTALHNSSAPFLLLARDLIVAPDARTLETLLVLAEESDVASASCVVLREATGNKGGVHFHSGGYFPSHVSFMAAPHLALIAPDCSEALPDATYPVAANQLDFALLPRRAAEFFAAMEPSAFDGAQPDLVFGLAALAAGSRHLCTSAVRVVSVGSPPPVETFDPLAAAFTRLAGWEAILSRITLLRDLR